MLKLYFLHYERKLALLLGGTGPACLPVHLRIDLILKLTKPKKKKWGRQHGSWGEQVILVAYPGVKVTSFLAFNKQGTGSES